MIIVFRRFPGARVSSHTTPSGMTAKVAAALTPPTMATANPASAAARLGEPRWAPITRGNNTHGASALGHASIEAGPSGDRIRGEAASAQAAMHGAATDRTPLAVATSAAQGHGTQDTP